MDTLTALVVSLLYFLFGYTGESCLYDIFSILNTINPEFNGEKLYNSCSISFYKNYHSHFWFVIFSLRLKIILSLISDSAWQKVLDFHSDGAQGSHQAKD